MIQRPWLTFLSIGVLSTITLVFFALRLRPVKPDVVTSQAPAVGSVTAPTVTFVNPSKGAANPKVTVVEFGDFQCESCKTLSDNLTTVMRDYPDTVRLVWKDMPNEGAHALATKAAIAAHCADRQGKFWEYHDLLFDRQSYLSEDELQTAAADASLDTAAFKACTDANDTLAIVRNDFEEGQALGILATPTIYVGSQPTTGALTPADLTRLIDAALASAAK